MRLLLLPTLVGQHALAAISDAVPGHAAIEAHDLAVSAAVRSLLAARRLYLHIGNAFLNARMAAARRNPRLSEAGMGHSRSEVVKLLKAQQHRNILVQSGKEEANVVVDVLLKVCTQARDVANSDTASPRCWRRVCSRRRRESTSFCTPNVRFRRADTASNSPKSTPASKRRSRTSADT